jgi:hydroxyethylthiazole kinase
MGKVVGTGCMAASVVGCFTGVESDYAVASSVALGLFGLACERAAKKTKLPGSFKSAVYDEVYSLTEKGVDGVRISED